MNKQLSQEQKDTIKKISEKHLFDATSEYQKQYMIREFQSVLKTKNVQMDWHYDRHGFYLTVDGVTHFVKFVSSINNV